VLRAEQHRRFAGVEATWLDNIGGLPGGPLLLVANEFLDTLPIRQLVRGRAHWAERLGGVDAAEGGGLCFAEGPESPALTLLVPPPRRATPPRTIVELCPAATTLTAGLAERLSHQQGAALFVDYGYSESPGRSTLSAIGGHRATGFLDAPGAAD